MGKTSKEQSRKPKKSTIGLYYLVPSLLIVLGVLVFSINQSNKLTKKVNDFQAKVTKLSQNYTKLNKLYESEKKLNQDLNNLNKAQKKVNDALVKDIGKKKRDLAKIRRRIIQKEKELKKVNNILKQKDELISSIKVQHKEEIETLQAKIDESLTKASQKNSHMIDSLQNQIHMQQTLKAENIVLNTYDGHITGEENFVTESELIKEIRVNVKLNHGITADNKLRVELLNNDIKYVRFSYLEKMVAENEWNFDFLIEEEKKLSKGILSAKVYCDLLYIGDITFQID
jgi:DNA repair exonuclease SbcCD ATPase subunit